MNYSNNTKTVYLIRHGQSNHNTAPVFQSRDSSLSVEGIKQAQALARRISKVSFDVLLTSPLSRARETAEIISRQTGMKPEFSELFVERVMPSAILGKPHMDTNANFLWREWEKSLYTPGLHIEDSENYDDLILRADEALNFLEKRTEASIIVVSHGYFLRTIIARVLLGESLSAENFHNFQKFISMENTAITILKFASAFEEDTCWRLDTYNDYSHLA